MIKAWHLFRVAIGVIYFVFGLNGFYPIVPVPTPPPDGLAFLQALFATGYMVYLWKGLEIICGFLLIINRFVPLALILLAPISVNIFCYHAFLDPSGLTIGAFILVSNILLAFGFKQKYKPLLKAKNLLEF